MMRLLNGITKADQQTSAGQRRPECGPLEQLERFELNDKISLYDVVNDIPVASDRATGEIIITVEPWLEFKKRLRKGGVTHFQFSFSAAAVDFKSAEYQHSNILTEMALLADTDDAPDSFTMTVPPDSPYPVIITGAIKFFELVNEKFWPDNSKARNAGAILLVNKP